MSKKIFVKNSILLFFSTLLIGSAGLLVVVSNPHIGTKGVGEPAQAEVADGCNSENDPEIKELISRLRDREMKLKSSEKTFDAMRVLGNIRCAEAAPAIAENIDLEKKFPSISKNKDSVVVEDWDIVSLWKRYPAMGALLEIGKPALPELLKIIENEPADSVRSTNALITLQSIFSMSPEAVAYLENAETKTNTKEVRERLEIAIVRTRRKLSNIKT